jgi:hypothetical protein
MATLPRPLEMHFLVKVFFCQQILSFGILSEDPQT